MLDHFSLAPQGPVLNLDLHPGDTYAVMGPTGSGKSQFLACVDGQNSHKQGSITVHVQPTVAGAMRLRRMQTPQTLAKALQRGGSSGLAAEALTALGLWEVRQEPVARLSHGQVVACALLPCLLSSPQLVLIDGYLDELDPWVLDPTLALFQELARSGLALLVATNRPVVAKRLGSLVVWSRQVPKFAGSIRELLRRHASAELTVETHDPSAVKAMAEAFAVSIHETEGGLRIEAEDGQATAAKLLTQGYGSVRAVVLREPSFEDALLRLV